MQSPWVWAADMAQWVKLLATELGDLGLIPTTHMVKGENRLHKVVLCGDMGTVAGWGTSYKHSLSLSLCEMGILPILSNSVFVIT